MCYNDCSHFHFNPMTGDDRCSLPSHSRCPDDDETLVSNCCGVEKWEMEENDICPKCKEHCEWEEEVDEDD